MILSGALGAASPATVSVSISSSLNSFRAQKRYGRGLTIAEFKCKLELVVGSPASCMDLELYTSDDKFVMKLDSDEALLGSYPIDDGCRIHVIDRSGARVGEYEDVSRVEKYEMSATDYEKRPDSVRSFLKRSKVGKFNEEEMLKKEAEQEQKLAEEKALAETISVGARCEVRVSGQPNKRGTVMFVGKCRWPPAISSFPLCLSERTILLVKIKHTKSGCDSVLTLLLSVGLTEFKPGYWIGVKYDEPLGKNDGSINGKQYFECQPKYGAFVKPQYVTVGDFPEEDYGLDDEM
ncbi:tubulin-folding cofactor B isoform X1 [Chelonia mydas]|uniref:tubulin-folding cofactor B isoform X1 n=1 Tax=Chelonia mydas TaxID=8469 RepID=UPI001CA9439D|nr:tubulin-folding cofactor B isoform X1 [Chelonia mydas]